MSLPQKPARPARTPPPPRPAEAARSPEGPQADAAGAGRFYLLIGVGVAGLLGGSVLLGVVIGSAMGSRGDNSGTRQASLPTPPKIDSAARELQVEREVQRQRQEAERARALERLQQAAENASDSPPLPDGAAASVGGALADLHRPDRPRVGDYPLLELPPRDFSLTGPRGPVMLARIHAASPQECELTLAGSEVALGAGRQFRLKRRDEGESRLWDVETFTPNSLNSPHVGTFRLSREGVDVELSFAWTSATENGADPQMLRYCLLNVHAQGEAAVCVLGRPERVAKIQLNLNHRSKREPVNLEIPRSADEHVRLDLWFEPGERLSAWFPAGSERGNGPGIGAGPTLGHAGGPAAGDAGLAPPRERGGKGEGLRKRGLEVGGDRPLYQVLLGEDENGGAGRPSSKLRCVAFNVSFGRKGDRLEVMLETRLFPLGFEWKRGTPPSYRFFESEAGEVWTRGNFDDYCARLLKERVAIRDEKLLRAFSDEVRKRTERVADLERLGAADQLTAARAELDRWRGAREEHDRAIKFTEDAEKWCDEMLELFDQIERELRIGYRVYIVVEGQEIELVRTVDESAAVNEEETR